MAIVAPSVSQVLLLKYMVNKTAPTDLVLRLYTNNYTPVIGSVLGSFTECVDSGYSEISLTGASWTVSTVSTISSAVFSDQTFSLDGTVSIYGYYYTDASGASLLGAERFANAPYNIGSSGGEITISPILSLTYES